MISAHDVGDIVPRPFGDRVRICAVAHHIATTYDAIVAGLRVGKDGLERLPVGMDVAEDQVAHRRRRDTSGGAPRRTGTPMVPIPFET